MFDIQAMGFVQAPCQAELKSNSKNPDEGDVWMSCYPESLRHKEDEIDRGGEPLAFAVTHAAIEELRECLHMLHHCVGQLSPGQFWDRPGDDQNAIANLLLHLEGNLRQWVVVGLGNAQDARNRRAEFEERQALTAGDLLSRIEGCVSEAIAVLRNTASAERLLTVRRIQGFEVHGIAAVQHSVSHFRGHTQEIVGRTRQLLGKDYRFAWLPLNAEQGG